MCTYYVTLADPSGREGKRVGLRPLACWDCEFESRQQHGFPSLVCIVCRQVQVYVGLVTGTEEPYQV